MDFITEEEKFYVSKGMIESGGSFVKYLGECVRCADAYNLRKIKDTWSAYWDEYLKIGRELYDKEKALFEADERSEPDFGED